MGTVVLGRVTEVPRSRLIAWAALVTVLASISYAANFLGSTDVDVDSATNTKPIVVTTSKDHGYETGDAVTVRDVEGNTGANGTWRVIVRNDVTLALEGSAGTGAYTSGGTDMFYGEASASVVLGVLPAFAVAFMLQRYLVKGLALGGTKG